MPSVRLEHAALWVQDLDTMRAFYTTYLGGAPGGLYRNPTTGFSSYFLSFGRGARLELMHMDSIAARDCGPAAQHLGLAHLAFGLGSRDAVDDLTDRLRADGFVILGEPRLTGDGYYESTILDPEGNRVELTA